MANENPDYVSPRKLPKLSKNFSDMISPYHSQQNYFSPSFPRAPPSYYMPSEIPHLPNQPQPQHQHIGYDRMAALAAQYMIASDPFLRSGIVTVKFTKIPLILKLLCFYLFTYSTVVHVKSPRYKLQPQKVRQQVQRQLLTV